MQVAAIHLRYVWARRSLVRSRFPLYERRYRPELRLERSRRQSPERLFAGAYFVAVLFLVF